MSFLFSRCVSAMGFVAIMIPKFEHFLRSDPSFGLNIDAILQKKPVLARRIVPMSYRDGAWQKIPSRIQGVNRKTGEVYFRGRLEGEKIYLSPKRGSGYPQRLAEYSPNAIYDLDNNVNLKQEINIIKKRSLDWSFGLALGEGLFAIDCDVDDAVLSEQIYNVIRSILGEFPVRIRENSSSRWASVFICDGYAPDALKNIKFGNEVVEFLAEGCGLVVSGYHTSGAKYFWMNGGVQDAITISPEQLLSVRQAIEGLGGSVRRPGRPRREAKLGVKGNVILYDWGGSPSDLYTLDNRVNYSATLEVYKWRRFVQYLESHPQKISSSVDAATGDNMLFFPCPNASEHSGMTGNRDFCIYYPQIYTSGGISPNAFDYDGRLRIRFHCFHSHCEGKSVDEMLEYFWKDYIPSIQERLYPWANVISKSCVIKLQNGESKSVQWLAFRGYHCEPEPSLIAMTDFNFVRFELAHDLFKSERVYRTQRSSAWCRWDDNTAAKIAALLNHAGFRTIDYKKIEMAFRAQESYMQINTFRNYICENRRKFGGWDGVPRISKVFDDIFHAVEGDTIYHNVAWHEHVALYFFTALWARATSGAVFNERGELVDGGFDLDGDGGIQADSVLVLYGDQGVHKSQACKVLALCSEYFTDALTFEGSDADLVRKERGKVLVELAEAGEWGRKGINFFKRWTSRSRNRMIPKFKEYEVDMVRTSMPVVTTNDDDILQDTTGERRKYIIPVGVIDIEALRRVVWQLWMEAEFLYKTYNGVIWRPAHEYYTMMYTPLNAGFRREDAWEDSLRAGIAFKLKQVEFGETHVNDLNGGKQIVILSDGGYIIAGLLALLGVPVVQRDVKASQHIQRILRSWGWIPRKASRTVGGGVQIRAWYPPDGWKPY